MFYWRCPSGRRLCLPCVCLESFIYFPANVSATCAKLIPWVGGKDCTGKERNTRGIDKYIRKDIFARNEAGGRNFFFSRTIENSGPSLPTPSFIIVCECVCVCACGLVGRTGIFITSPSRLKYGQGAQGGWFLLCAWYSLG